MPERNYIRKILSSNYQLRNRLPVTLEICNNIYVATNRYTGMYGTGLTKRKAVDDLRDVIIEYYESLKEDKHRLGSLPTRHWKYLNRIIKEG